MSSEQDPLEERLRRIDPVPPDVHVDTPRSQTAAALMRRIMDTTAAPDALLAHGDAPHPPRRTWARPLLAAAAAVLVIGAGAVVATGLFAGDDEEPVVASYELAAFDPISSICLPVTETVPDPAAEAFGGIVTAVEPGVVTMEVDRWYTAGEADVVELRAGTDVSTALDGVEFVEGERYLVTTVGGVVSICGVSAPASPELEQLYQQWYS